MINLKLTILFFLPAAFLLLLAACGDTQSLPDIDATVEARVEQAKASLVAPTAAPLPTYTPYPVPTPEVVVVEVIVEKIVEKVVTVAVTPTPTQVPPTATPIPSPATAGAAVANRLAALGWSESEALAVAKKVRASTVTINGGGGWVAASDLVVTNGHVTPEVGATVSLETITGVHFLAVVLESSLNPDLAILRVTSNISELPPPLSIGTTSPGNPVMAVGHPNIVGNWAVTVGEVVSVEPDYWILADVSTAQGNSGGPAVNQDGEVIGVVSARTTNIDISSIVVVDLKILLHLEDYAIPTFASIVPWGFVAAMVQRHQ